MRKILPVGILLFVSAMMSAEVFAAGRRAFVEDSSTNRVLRAGWINVDDSHYLSGPVLTPEDLNTRVVVVHRWCLACPDIDNAVKDFQRLAKRYADTDFVFLTSYFPGQAHSRQDVENALKRLNVKGSAYVGAASAGVRVAKDHRAMYIVEGGSNEVWSLRLNNTDMQELSRQLDTNRARLEEASLRLAAEYAPGRALVHYKKMKKANSKAAAALKPLIDKIDTPENRQMADFEEKSAAVLAKGSKALKDQKALREKLEKFAEKASDDLKDEIAALLAALG